MRNRATLPPMNLAVRKPMTLAEFLAWEERQELRYEFDGSEPVAMAGGTATYADIQGTYDGASEAACAESRAKFFGSDLKILVAGRTIRYPDGMVGVLPSIDPPTPSQTPWSSSRF